MSANEIIITLSGLTILAYLFNVISKWTRIPSVLLLLATGILLRLLVKQPDFLQQIQSELLDFLGSLGLVIIVLEASLDLHLQKGKQSIIRGAFFSATVIFLISSFSISSLFHFWLGDSLRNCLIYAIPFSIISSAIAIPSAEHLSGIKREFIIYESSFSDIIGIFLFNFLTQRSGVDISSPVSFLVEVIAVFIVALIASFSIIWLGGKIGAGIRHFFLLSLLVLLYALGKAIHLPALIIVLVFGLMLNNFDRLGLKRVVPFTTIQGIDGLVEQFKIITMESSFILRTFFFIFFGFTIDISTLLAPEGIAVSLAIVLILLLVRYAYLRWALKDNVYPEIFVMPRGLITILLFFSIPSQFTITHFDQSIVLLVVITTTILMSIALIVTKDNPKWIS